MFKRLNTSRLRAVIRHGDSPRGLFTVSKKEIGGSIKILGLERKQWGIIMKGIRKKRRAGDGDGDQGRVGSGRLA